MANTPITVSIPPLPEGFSGTPDDFLAWIANNMEMAINGNLAATQIGGAIDKTQDNGLYVDVAGRTLEAWDASATKYVTIGVPVGSIMPFAGILAPLPTNWLYCEGQSLLQTAYPELYAILGTAWGSIATGQFNLPDLRGRFLIHPDSISPDSGGNLTGNAALTPTVGAGRLPSYTNGTYVGSTFPTTSPPYVGAPAGFKVSLDNSNSSKLTSIIPPSVVMRSIIRAR